MDDRDAMAVERVHVERSGIQGEAITVETSGSSAAAITTAPPIENPRAISAPSSAASVIAARQSSMHQVSRFHDLIRWRTRRTELGELRASR